MNKSDLKIKIVSYLLECIRVKPLIELDEEIANFYESDGGKQTLNGVLDEVYEELKNKYEIE